MEKRITVDNKIVNYDAKLNKNTAIDIFVDEELNYKKNEGDLDIIYEDDDILVVNKKSGIIIHDEANSLANIVASYYEKKGLNRMIRYPSRLDNETSGVMIFPKHFLSAAYFDYLFREHLVTKTYRALAYHSFSATSGKVSLKIGTDRHINGKMCTSKNGQEALTYYNILKQNKDIAYVNLVIKTGRTHQIRVHLSSIGHPVLGDNLYGKSSIKRVMLHAYSIEFVHPIKKEKMTIIAPIPLDMQTIIDNNFKV